MALLLLLAPQAASIRQWPFLAMGKGVSKVYVFRDQLSLDNPKVKSALSGPLDEHADYDTFWDCLLDVLVSETHNFLDPGREGKIKETQVTRTPNETIVTRIIDGKKFDVELANQLGLNRQLLMAPEEMKRFTAGPWTFMEKFRDDKEEGTLSIEKYATEPYRMLNTAHIKVHREPLVLEYWLETLRPRFNSDFLKWGINRELDEIARRVFKDDGYMLAMYALKKSMPNEDPLVTKWSSSLSDPAWDAFVTLELDDLFDYDTLWSELVKLTKRPPWHEGVLCFPNGPGKFKIEVPPATETDARGHMRVVYSKRVEELTIDEAKGKIRNLKYDGWGGVKNIDYHVLHRNPLRLEVWSELLPKRRSGKLVQFSAQVLLDAVLDRVEATSGFIEGAEEEFSYEDCFDKLESDDEEEEEEEEEEDYDECSDAEEED